METLTKKQLVQDFYSEDFDWEKINYIDKAIKYELCWGPLGPNYWNNVEPLSSYRWVSLGKACEDLRLLLDGMPYFIYYDFDSDCIYEMDPWDNVIFWKEDYYIGPQNYMRINPYGIVLSKIVFQTVF